MYIYIYAVSFIHVDMETLKQTSRLGDAVCYSPCKLILLTWSKCTPCGADVAVMYSHVGTGKISPDVVNDTPIWGPPK